MLRPFALCGGLFLAAATFAAGDDGRPARELEFMPPPAGSYRLEHKVVLNDVRTLLIEQGISVN